MFRIVVDQRIDNCAKGRRHILSQHYTNLLCQYRLLEYHPSLCDDKACTDIIPDVLSPRCCELY
jgi:hypothetical protein